MNKEFPQALRDMIAPKVIEFLEQVTVTNKALSEIFNVSSPFFSMIKNKNQFVNITAGAWELFRDISNKKVYIDGHYIKDCRSSEIIKINMLEYQTKYGLGREKKKSESVPFDKKKHNNAYPVDQESQPEDPPGEDLTIQQREQLMMFWRDNPDVKIEDLIEGWEKSKDPLAEVLSPEQENLLKFLKNNREIKAEDIISIWNQYHDYEPPSPLPLPKKVAFSDEDIDRLKKFGMNFKRGIYLVHKDTVVELLAPVDLHNLLTQIIRGEFDRFINGVEWKFEDSVVKILKVVSK